MISIKDYCSNFQALFAKSLSIAPWDFVRDLQNMIMEQLAHLSADYLVNNNIAIHKHAVIEDHSVIKAPAIISEGCFVGAHAYLRGGVYLAPKVTIGPGCEVKTSLILHQSALAHFNFVGDSIIGSGVNMEAGSIVANHYNERKDKTIFIRINGKIEKINTTKFGALVGDETKIGANAVLSPGTILPQKSIVRRLELVNQCAE